MHNRMQRPVDGTAVVIRLTEILSSRLFLILCHMDGMGNQFLNSLVLCSRNRDDRNAKSLFHLIDEHGTAVLPHLIHHI